MVDQQPEAGQGNRRAWRICCGVPLALIAVLIVMSIVWPRGCDIINAAPWGYSAFDAEKWRAVDGESSLECVRGRMLNSLLITNRLANMTREEIHELLGRPESIEMPDDEWLWGNEFRAAELAVASRYEYYLGYCTAFGMDPDYLVVEFGDDGRVKNYWWQPT